MNLPYGDLKKGALLIASPDLEDPLLYRSVILLCDHSNIGSFGLILNKPVDVEFPEEILKFDETSNPTVQMRSGGPMQPSQMMLIHSSPNIPDQTLEVCPGVFLGGDLEFLQASVRNTGGPSILICFGYMGWSIGQLEQEFLSGDWFLAPATNELIFETDSGNLWQAALQTLGGKYASLSMLPPDLSLN